jgi:hypothetical protein
MEWTLHDLWANRMPEAVAQALIDGNSTQAASLNVTSYYYNATQTSYADGLARNDSLLLGQPVGLDGAPIRDTLNIGGDDEKKPREEERAGVEQRVDGRCRDEGGDKVGDGYLRPAKRQRRPASVAERLPERHRPSRRSVLLTSSDDGSGGESDGSNVTPARINTSGLVAAAAVLALPKTSPLPAGLAPTKRRRP